MTQVPARMAPATRLRLPTNTPCRIRTPRVAPARVSLQAKPSSAEPKTPEPPSPARPRSRQPLQPSRIQLRRRRSPRQRQARRPQAKGPFLWGHRPETSMYLLGSFFVKAFHSTHGVFDVCNAINLLSGLEPLCIVKHLYEMNVMCLLPISPYVNFRRLPDFSALPLCKLWHSQPHNHTGVCWVDRVTAWRVGQIVSGLRRIQQLGQRAEKGAPIASCRP